MSNTKNIYTATFTLTQEGLGGMVVPKLEFNPMLDPTSEEAPAIYEYMSGIALRFLRTVNAIDDNLNVVDENEWSKVQLNVMTEGKLN